MAGALLLAILVCPLSPASYGLAGVALATGMVVATGGKTPGMQLTGIIVSGLSLCSLNGGAHLLSLLADTLLFATLPTLVFPLMAVSLSIQLCPDGCPRFMPRHFFYMAYAGHLLVLLILMQLR
ncbi:TraX family plasmid conjugative transfer pilin acetylase [Enterobacter soli ATCC BAA-2102]|nr:TraX family plasmid conjugative transfer pilin acetylase [Enterobacter soli ATCC BAA-2102]